MASERAKWAKDLINSNRVLKSKGESMHKTEDIIDRAIMAAVKEEADAWVREIETLKKDKGYLRRDPVEVLDELKSRRVQ